MPDEKMGGAAKKIPVLLTPQLLLFCSPRDTRKRKTVKGAAMKTFAFLSRTVGLLTSIVSLSAQVQGADSLVPPQ
jgi:hypothetical protein